MIPKFYLRPRHDFLDAIEIRFGGFTDDRCLVRAEPVNVLVHAKDSVEAQMAHEDTPMLTLSGPDSRPVMQDLMDQLWKLGYRPNDIGTTGHLDATNRHLDDMRKLVSKAYAVTL